MNIFILTFLVDCQGGDFDALKSVTTNNKVVMAWAAKYHDYGTMKIHYFSPDGDCLGEINLAETVKQNAVVMDNGHRINN